jgi:acylphosphatase
MQWQSNHFIERPWCVNTSGTVHMEDDKDGMLRTRLVRVRGLVQGIGYRDACVRRARELGMTGWVRNRLDNSVEVLLQGSPEQIADMCVWLSQGMSAAIVDVLEVTEVLPPFVRFEHFERSPTV